ncbi:MAG TPA: AIR synthase related protein, partial [Candidatus Binatia bacterium]|nr:AIR synthase related protein [Candidatus Binatia bacterium]
MTTYAQSGVNNDLKEQASKMLYEAAKRTWENRKGKFGEIISAHDDFSALRGINVGNLPEGTMLSLGFDGVGTKMELGERLNKHDTVAFDLFAMVCDDAVVRGAEPVLVGSILDVKSLKTPEGNYFLDQLSQLANGYEAAAKAARVAVINGEIAELGARVSGYGAFNYNWGASVALFAQKHRAITGKDIAPGQALVGLREYGFRSNGLSLVRKIFREHFGEEYQSYGHVTMQALRPSTIYCAAVCDMFGGA